MLIVGERINASRKAIRAALEAMDASAIQQEARAQDAAGAHYIDVNGGTFPGREPELLSWLVDTVQAVTAKPLCLDSPDATALAAALPRVKTPPPMINSINLERDRYERILPLVRDHRTKVIALCQGEDVPAATAAQKVALGSELVERLTRAGIPLDDIYVDPLVFPLGTDSQSAQATIEAIGTLMQRFPGVHTICGLTNVSHGLPARKLINRTFLVGAMGRGMDAAIVDPTDPQLVSALFAARAVFGQDEYCMELIEAFRAGAVTALAPARFARLSARLSPAMPRVTFHPDSRAVDVRPGERLLAAAWRAGVGIKSVCGGHGKCGSCLVEIDVAATAADALTPVSPTERELLPAQPEGGAFRLACLCDVHGDVTLSVPPESQALRNAPRKPYTVTQVEPRPVVTRVCVAVAGAYEAPLRPLSERIGSARRRCRCAQVDRAARRRRRRLLHATPASTASAR